MKKVLFVLGLALCSTVAMAQTNKVADKLCTNNEPAVAKKLVVTDNHPIDYKASIFTKDDDVVLHRFGFGSADSVSIDVIRTGDMLDGSPVAAAAAHNRTQSHLRWHRIADSAATRTSEFTADYAGMLYYMSVANINAYMGVRNGIAEDNGFMILSLSEDPSVNNQGINTYFELPAIALPNGLAVVDITWRQYYRKYYDMCYIDYWKDTSWFQYEINVTGIDVEVTGLASSVGHATLPSAAIQQDSLKLRFRLQADGGNWYGYGWCIDDVRVISVSATARWSFHHPGYINGFYGTVPEGFTVPISYAVNSRNTSVDSLYGNKVTFQHRYYDEMDGAWDEWSEVFYADQDGMGSGNATADFLFEVNESGFMAPGVGFTNRTAWIYQTYPDYYEMYGNTDAELATAGYTRRGLPAESAGKHQFNVITSNANGLNDTLDIMTYTVSEDMDADTSRGRTVPGYRWSNDNGIVPAGSEFAYGFTDATVQGGAGYVTATCDHQYAEDYQVLTRYNTPSVIPTDANGNPWVIRGIEYVTSTKLVAGQVAGATIYPLFYRYNLTDSAFVRWDSTGINQYYSIDENSAPATQEELVGYSTLESGNYYCYNVLLPGQPALEPNHSYLVGYLNIGGGDFAVARTSYTYKFDDSTNVAYRNDPAIADYYNQLVPSNKIYDAYSWDPLASSRNDTSAHSVSGLNADYYPMIRLIVGPKMEIHNYELYFDCGGDENVGDYWMTSGNTNLCGLHDTLTQGTMAAFYVLPGFEDEYMFMDEETGYFLVDTTSDFIPSKVIDQILIDNVPIDLNDETMVTKEPYDFYWPGHAPSDDEAWAPALQRYYYRVALRNINANHDIKAVVRTEQLNIRNIEDNVNLTLAPNPATSQVRLNVAGFTGKANCSVIDMSGRVIYNADINAGETVLNLNGVPAGAYFVRVTNDTFSKVEKLIVR